MKSLEIEIKSLSNSSANMGAAKMVLALEHVEMMANQADKRLCVLMKSGALIEVDKATFDAIKNALLS